MSDEGLCPCGEKLAVYVFDGSRGARVIAHPTAGPPAEAFCCVDCVRGPWWERDSPDVRWREMLPEEPDG